MWTPFCRDSTGAPCAAEVRSSSATASVSHSFTATRTRSVGPSSEMLATTESGEVRSSPRGLWTTSPDRRMAARCPPRATKVTSFPAAANRAPK